MLLMHYTYPEPILPYGQVGPGVGPEIMRGPEKKLFGYFLWFEKYLIKNGDNKNLWGSKFLGA